MHNSDRSTVSNVQKADPGARRAAVMIVAAGTLIGVIAIALARIWRSDFEAWVEQDLTARMRLVMAALTALTAGPLFGLAAYLWRLGARVTRERRYPPSGMRLVHDTPIVAGEAAAGRGRMLRMLALIVSLAAGVLAVLLWRLVFLFEALGTR